MFHETGGIFVGMHFLWWMFWIVLIGTAFVTVTPLPKQYAKSGPRALDILRRRYAAGELSSEEYERRKAIIVRDEPTSGPPAHAH